MRVSLNGRRFPMRSGFTLVELALAVLVLAVGLLGTFSLLTVGLGAGRNAVDDSELAMLGNTVLSDLRGFMATNFSTTAGGYEIVLNGETLVANGATVEIPDTTGAEVLCRALLSVQAVPGAGGNLAEANLRCWPGRQTTRSLQFYARYTDYNRP